MIQSLKLSPKKHALNLKGDRGIVIQLTSRPPNRLPVATTNEIVPLLTDRLEESIFIQAIKNHELYELY